jgi:hypothetical protein
LCSVPQPIPPSLREAGQTDVGVPAAHKVLGPSNEDLP